MAWYYQTSPHDTHDWDSAQTPVLFDGADQRPAAQARRDRGAQRLLLRARSRRPASGSCRRPFGSRVNWATGLDEKGRPKRDPQEGCDDRRVARVAQRGRRDQLGAAGVQSRTPGSSTSPRRTRYSIFYLLDPDPRGSMGLGGKLEAHVGSAGSYLTAIDYKTGKVAWREEYPGVFGGGGGGGLLTTAGGLVFAGDAGGNIVAHDAKTGKPLWHSRIGNVTNAPTTYMLDGRQYLLVAVRRHAVRVFAVSVNTVEGKRQNVGCPVQTVSGSGCTHGAR